MNRRIFQYGAWMADEARAHHLPVVDALPFESLLDRARGALGPKGRGSRRSEQPHRRPDEGFEVSRPGETWINCGPRGCATMADDE